MVNSEEGEVVMRTKTAMVTGANSGMGLATAIELAKQGAHVIMVCRNQHRGEEALYQVSKKSGSKSISLMLCNLGSFSSIQRFAKSFEGQFNQLDVLINNAGVVTIKRQTTINGYEMMLGVNYLGHFLLTILLLDSIKKSSDGRIINISSGAHKIGKIDIRYPNLSKSYNPATAYGRSKLLNILFTKELQRREPELAVFALHPGAVATNLGVDRNSGFGEKVYSYLHPFFLSPSQGSETAVFLATNETIPSKKGNYFYRKQVAPTAKTAKDEVLAKQVWEWGMNQVKLYI